MTASLSDLGLDASLPLIAAPMAGGPTTPELALAAGRAGGFGFLAAGYKTPAELAAQLATVRSDGRPFGVNLFAPNPVPIDAAEFRRYAEVIDGEARRYGLSTDDAVLRDDDDGWRDKIDLLLADPVAVVSFTFGIPERAVIVALKDAGTLVVQTVTSVAEARLAVDAGADALAVQASAAGGHSGTLTPAHIPAVVPITQLVAAVRTETTRPLFAAGGLATSADVAAVLRAGASAAVVGTVLLLVDEAGTSAPYRAALVDPRRDGTVVTRAFTGRPARALRNEFADRYTDEAPAGYPALHYLTRPIRVAAAAAGDPERLNLWAGTGYRHARSEPAASVFVRLAAEL